MIDNQTIIQAIDQSPLLPEDKAHWKELLPKMSEEQKKRFLETLTTKTEVSQAINSIKRALKIVAEAEAEAREEEKIEEAERLKEVEKEKLLRELETSPHIDQNVPADTRQDLLEHQKKTEAKLTKLREELSRISQEIQGTPPPSFQNR